MKESARIVSSLSFKRYAEFLQFSNVLGFLTARMDDEPKSSTWRQKQM